MKFRSAPKSELVLAMLRNSAVLVKREKLTAEDAEDRAEALRKLAFWGTPLPPVLWNQRLSVKLRNDLWRSMTYGQNLDFMALTPFRINRSRTAPPW